MKINIPNKVLNIGFSLIAATGGLIAGTLAGAVVGVILSLFLMLLIGDTNPDHFNGFIRIVALIIGTSLCICIFILTCKYPLIKKN